MALNLCSMGNISIQDWIKIVLNSKSCLGLKVDEVNQFQLFALILCDQIWMTRNKVRVEGLKSNPTELLRQILRSFKEHNQAWRAQPKRHMREIKWQAPPESWVKLNFDPAIRDEKTSIVVVCKDDKGVLLMAWA